MKFMLNETVTTYPDGKVYDAEVGTITKVFLGFEDHGSFAFRIDIEEPDGTRRSSGDRGIDPATSFGTAFIAKLIKTFGGKYNSSLTGLIGQRAILIRDNEASWSPVGLACPKTSEVIFFHEDYTEEMSKKGFEDD